MYIPEKYIPKKYSTEREDIKKLTIDEIISRVNKIENKEETEQWRKNIEYIGNNLEKFERIEKKATELAKGKILELKNHSINIFKGLELAVGEEYIENRIKEKEKIYSIDSLKEKEKELKKLLLEEFTEEALDNYIALISTIISNLDIRVYKNFLLKNMKSKI